MTGETRTAEGRKLTGKEIVRLMRVHKVTMRGLKAKFQITLKRIREVRSQGVQGFSADEWVWLITGMWPDETVKKGSKQ